MKPTTFATPAVVVSALGTTPTSSLQLSARPIQTGSIVLAESQLPSAQALLDKFDFGKMTFTDIILIGHEEEQAISRMLDGFLSKLDKDKASKTFSLLSQLTDGVEDAKLPEVLMKIQNPGKLGTFGKLLNLLKSRKALEKAAAEALTQTRNLLTGRTATLRDQMARLEAELQSEVQVLIGDLGMIEQLKDQYGEAIADMALIAAVSQAYVPAAESYVEQKAKEAAANPDATKQSELQELQSKLAQLKSRALALEGSYSRLPAEQLVTQQIQDAGVSTLQETATGGLQRFVSLKSTLLALHGALSVQSLQQTNAKNAHLEQQLLAVRASAMKQVVTTAATAPGENRLQQAKQIETIIAQAKELNTIVKSGRDICNQKFDEARGIFAKSREELSRFALEAKA